MSFRLGRRGVRMVIDGVLARWLANEWPDAYRDVGGVVHRVADRRVVCTGHGPVDTVATAHVWTREAACHDCEWPHPSDRHRREVPA